jgi:RNA polymerase primary sigma factor
VTRYDLDVPKRTNGSHNATLHAYLREIGKIPQLRPEEERELGTRVRRDKDEEALGRLVEANLRFVVSYAKRYRNLGVPLLDLIHEGNLGLIEAARRYDPSRNVKFITYAVWWIRQSIMQALSDHARAFSLPTKLSAVASKFNRQVAALSAQLDHAPTAREIAEDLEISEASAGALMQISGEDVSLSERVGLPDGSNGRELGDTIEQVAVPPVDEELIQEAMAAQLRAALSELDARERDVMSQRFGLEDGEPKTLQEVGRRLNLSRERIRQIEACAKEKLRRSAKSRDLRSYLN